MEPSDERELLRTSDLLSRARAGDARARDELFASYSARLIAFLHARLPASDRGMLETQDLAQDVALEAFKRLDRFEYRGIGSFWGYLRRIALNNVMDARRRSGRRPASKSLLDDSARAPSSPEPSPLHAMLDEEQQEAFERALTTLRDDHRDALLLRLEVGMGYELIARECGFSSAAVARMTVSRVVKQVAREMSRDGQEPRPDR